MGAGGMGEEVDARRVGAERGGVLVDQAMARWTCWAMGVRSPAADLMSVKSGMMAWMPWATKISARKA